ncbi:hypothetical protein BC831DRAFT_392908, partial [Entophlyctis helioformis]
MARFVIAGRADDPQFAKVEMLGYHLQDNLPDFKVRVHAKTAAEWPAFVKEMFGTYGWGVRVARDRTHKQPDRLDQLIWIESGELIGKCRADFLGLIRHAYNQEYNLDPELLESIAAENVANVA